MSTSAVVLDPVATETPRQNLTVPERAERVEARDLDVKFLGPCRIDSPIAARLGAEALHTVGRAERVLLDDRLSRRIDGPREPSTSPPSSWPGRATSIFFEPSSLRCGIVTCGGLCPGINNVIRGLVLELTHGYGVKEIFGFRYGYEGLVARTATSPSS